MCLHRASCHICLVLPQELDPRRLTDAAERLLQAYPCLGARRVRAQPSTPRRARRLTAQAVQAGPGELSRHLQPAAAQLCRQLCRVAGCRPRCSAASVQLGGARRRQQAPACTSPGGRDPGKAPRAPWGRLLQDLRACMHAPPVQVDAACRGEAPIFSLRVTRLAGNASLLAVAFLHILSDGAPALHTLCLQRTRLMARGRSSTLERLEALRASRRCCRLRAR